MRERYIDLFSRMIGPDPVKRDAAFDAVLFDRGEALPDLVECYQAPGTIPLLRFYVVQLMGFSGHRGAIPVLVQATCDPDPAVRAEACRSLDDLEAREARPQLEARLNDLDPGVREAAREALERLG